MDTYISKFKDFASAASSAAIATTNKISETINGRIGRDYKILQDSPSFRCGLWNLRPAETSRTKKKVTLWIFDKKILTSQGYFDQYGDGGIGFADKREIETILSFLKNEIAQLTKLRHPSILKVVESIEETRSSLIFVTETVLSTLFAAISPREKSHAFEIDDIEIQKGFQQLIEGLQFLHSSGIVHTSLNPSNIMISEEGDWKLSGFGFASNIKATHSSYDTYSGMNDIPQACQRNLEFSAPELILEKRIIDKNDIYSLGCVLFSIYNNANSIITNTDNDAYKYEQKIDSIKNLKFPATENATRISEYVLSLAAYKSENRISLASFLSSGFFNNIYAQTLLSLENGMQMSNQQQLEVLKQLVLIVNKYSSSTQVRKIQPKLNMLLNFVLNQKFSPESLEIINAYIIISSSIAEKMDSSEFINSLLPLLIKCYSIAISYISQSEVEAITVNTTLHFLDNLGFIQKKCASYKDAYDSTVLPVFYSLIDKGNDIHTKVLEKVYLSTIPTLSLAMDKYAFNNTLYPKILNQYKTTNMLVIKIDIIKCIEKIASSSTASTINEQVLPTLLKTKSRNMDLVFELIKLFMTLAQHSLIQDEQLFKLVIPTCYTLLYESKFSERLFKAVIINVEELSRIAHKTLHPLKNYTGDSSNVAVSELADNEDFTQIQNAPISTEGGSGYQSSFAVANNLFNNPSTMEYPIGTDINRPSNKMTQIMSTVPIAPITTNHNVFTAPTITNTAKMNTNANTNANTNTNNSFTNGSLPKSERAQPFFPKPSYKLGQTEPMKLSFAKKALPLFSQDPPKQQHIQTTTDKPKVPLASDFNDFSSYRQPIPNPFINGSHGVLNPTKKPLGFQAKIEKPNSKTPTTSDLSLFDPFSN